MLQISLYNRNQLDLQRDLKKHETNEYLKDLKNPNLSYLKEKFFRLEDRAKVALLNNGSNLFSTISNIYASYVGTPQWDYDYSLFMNVQDYVALGFCVITLDRIDSVLVPTYQPAQNYFHQDGLDHIIRFYIDEDSDQKKYYALVQTFYPGRIENKLYSVTTFDDTSTGREVPLDSINDTSGLDEVVFTGLNDLNIFVVKADDKEQHPISIFQKVQPTVYSVDRKIMMFETQFLQNAESFVIFKNINFSGSSISNISYEEDGATKYGKAVDYGSLGRYLIGDEDSGVEFVENKNEFLDQAIQYEEKQVRRLSGMTCIPQEFLGLEQKNSAIGKGSRSLMHGAFIKKIEEIRKVFDNSLRSIEEILNSDSGSKSSYVRPDVFAKDDKQVLEEIVTKRELGIITKVKALMFVDGLTEEQANQELSMVNQESLDANIVVDAEEEEEDIQRE